MQIARPETLREAWRRVRGNRGGPGGDGVSLDAFAIDLEARLAALAAALRDGTYRPGPLRQAMLPRPDGRGRLLRIPCIRDRVAQTACHLAVAPRLDARMSPDSFGYRPARSVEQALARLRALARHGLPWALDADIVRFFDRVPHARLMDELAIWLENPRLLRLIGLWLESFGGGRGLAQGAPISPLLANLYLHPLDRALAGAGFPAVRYADDFVALAPSEPAARKARAVAAAALRRRGLRLNPAKTRLVRLADGLDFLGARIEGPRG